MTTKLVFAQKGCESTRLQKLVNTLKPFLKREVLIAGLALGVGAAPIIMPAPRAQDAKQEEVQGQKITATQLDKPLSQLEKETVKMAIYARPMSDGQKFTCQSTSVQTTGVNFIVNLATMKLTVTFEATKDDTTRGADAGGRGVDLHDFAKIVEKQTGRKLEGVKIILETGTFMYEGKEAQYTNAYLLPIDSQGKITTALGDGKYLVYGASYYADNHVAGEPAIIIEPNQTYSLSLSMASR